MATMMLLACGAWSTLNARSAGRSCCSRTRSSMPSRREVGVGDRLLRRRCGFVAVLAERDARCGSGLHRAASRPGIPRSCRDAFLEALRDRRSRRAATRSAPPVIGDVFGAVGRTEDVAAPGRGGTSAYPSGHFAKVSGRFMGGALRRRAYSPHRCIDRQRRACRSLALPDERVLRSAGRPACLTDRRPASS